MGKKCKNREKKIRKKQFRKIKENYGGAKYDELRIIKINNTYKKQKKIV